MAVNWNTVGKVLNSKAFETGAGIAGAGFSAAAAGKQREQDRAFQQQQLSQQQNQSRSATLARMFENEQARRDAASRDVADASPLGEMENFAGRQAFLRTILPQFQNYSVTPTDPGVAAAMPQISGGMRLPEGGIPQEALAHLSQQATAGALGRRQKQLSSIDTSTPTVDLQSLGIDPRIAEMEDTEVNSYIADLVTQREQGDDRMRGQIMAALDAEDAEAAQNTAGDGTTLNPDGSVPKGYEYDKKTGQLKKKGSSIWKKLGKVGLIAGGAALAATGVGGPAGAALIGAGIGAGSGAIDGGWKGALMGAGMGAATGGLMGGGGGAVAGNTTPQVIKNALINPRTLGQMGSQFVPGTAGQIAQLGTQFLPGAPTVLPSGQRPEFTPYRPAPTRRFS